MYTIILSGYWAYGSNTSSYLLNNVHGPIWLKAVANISAFLQTVIALHVKTVSVLTSFIVCHSCSSYQSNLLLLDVFSQIFASPMYECLDTKFGIKGSPFASFNLSFRIVVRGSYVAITSFVAALLPFLGDFMSLTGALSTYPLTFILANHMYLVAKRSKLSSLQKAWHWLNVVGFSCLAIAAAISALRLISMDSKTYHLFADM